MKSPSRQAHATILQVEDLHRDYLHASERGKIQILNGLKLEASRKVERQKLFKQGDFPQAAEGVFNPSAIFEGDRGKMILRCEPYAATWRGYWIDNKGIPCVSDYQIVQGKVKAGKPRSLSSGMPLASRPEDWRLFKHRGQTYTNFTNYFYYNRGFPQKNVKCRTALGKLEGDKIRFLREMDASDHGIAMNSEEKNWCFFSYNGELFCIYSIEPFVVMRCTNDGEIRDIKTTPLDLPRFGNRYIAQSCNPILTTLPSFGEVFLMFVHQFYTPHGRGTRNRTYYQHAFAFSPKTMKPVAWSPFPIVGGGTNCNGRHNGVMYISGLIQKGKEFFAFAGEGDANSVVFKLINRDLDEWMDQLT